MLKVQNQGIGRAVIPFINRKTTQGLIYFLYWTSYETLLNGRPYFYVRSGGENPSLRHLASGVFLKSLISMACRRITPSFAFVVI